MNMFLIVSGSILILGGFFGLGALFVRINDKRKQREKERSDYWIEIKRVEQRILAEDNNVINDLHEVNKKHEERIKELEFQLASYIILSKGIEISD